LRSYKRIFIFKNLLSAFISIQVALAPLVITAATSQSASAENNGQSKQNHIQRNDQFNFNNDNDREIETRTDFAPSPSLNDTNPSTIPFSTQPPPVVELTINGQTFPAYVADYTQTLESGQTLNLTAIDLSTDGSEEQDNTVISFINALSQTSDHTTILAFAENGVAQTDLTSLLGKLPDRLQASTVLVPVKHTLWNLVKEKYNQAWQKLDDFKFKVLGTSAVHGAFSYMGHNDRYRRWYSILRGGGNGLGIGLMVWLGQHWPLTDAIQFGGATLAMSSLLAAMGGLYLKVMANKSWSNYAKMSMIDPESPFWRYTSDDPKALEKFFSRIDDSRSTTVFSIIESFFIAVQDAVLIHLGHSPFSSIGGAVTGYAVSLGTGIAAQLPYDQGTSEMQSEFDKYFKNEADQDFFKGYSQFKTVLGSWAQVITVAFSLISPYLGNALLVALAKQGYRYKAAVDNMKLAYLNRFTCRSLLGKYEPKPVDLGDVRLSTQATLKNMRRYGNGTFKAEFQLTQ